MSVPTKHFFFIFLSIIRPLTGFLALSALRRARGCGVCRAETIREESEEEEDVFGVTLFER